jgi:hypothetical protein
MPLPSFPVALARLLAPLLAFGLALWVLLPALLGRRTPHHLAAATPRPATDAPPDPRSPTDDRGATIEDGKLAIVAPRSAILDPPDPRAHLPLLRQAIRQRQLIAIGYQAAEADGPTRRIVRPLLLEGHGERWYLRAYCTLRRDERLFRVDRITALEIRRGSLRQRGRPRRQERTMPPVVRARPAQARPALPRVSFFAPPPDPPPGSPLVRVWLVD